MVAWLGCSLALSAGGCSALWGGLAVPAPENCVTSATPCATGQVCNPRTQICEDELVLSQVTPPHGLTSEPLMVTLRGAAFAPGMSVQWNGSELTPLNILSASELTAMAPASPDGGWRVQIDAHLPSGLGASRSDLFSYAANAPSFTLANPFLANSQAELAVTAAPLLHPPRADILLLDGTLRLRFLALSPDGSMATDEARLAAPANTIGLLVGDLNQDGFADLVLASFQGFDWSAGSATPGLPPPTVLRHGVDAGAAMALGDVDQDGVPDLIGVHVSANSILALTHAGADLHEAPLPPSVAAVATLVVGEFDGQPGDDVVVSYQDTSTELGVLRGGAASLAYVSAPIAGCTNAQLQRGRLLKSGGAADILLSCTDRLQVLRSTGGGAFQLGATFALPATQSLNGAPVIADFDGDGNQDVFFLSTDSSSSTKQAQAFLLRNQQGNGTFTAVDLMAGVPKPTAPTLVVGDVNGDGKPDAIYVDRGGAQAPFYVFLNTSR
jgi:hypothetical protein